MRPHLILLHPPSHLDYRERKLRHALASATIATSPLFEYYPLGFLALLEYASRYGFDVRIINIAVKMAKSRRFDPRRLIRKLKPLVFGIDLHWLAHANGAFDLARICKEEHPEIPVLFGGLTSSYYHREIIESPHVDYVLRGDSTEQPVVDLLRALDTRREPSAVANLTWKRGGEVVVNPLTYQPDLLDIRIDYRRLIKHMLRYRDLRGGLLTGYQWPVYAFNMTLSCRGCLHTCLTCGGSNWALGRSALAVRDPEVLGQEVISMQQLTTSVVGVVGDLRQHEPDRLIAELRRHKPTRPLSFELFGAGGEDFLRKLASIGPPLDIHMSPESHDERLRARYGRFFSNEQVEADLDFALGSGGKALLFFVIGIPGQTRESVMESVAYAKQLLERYNGRYPGKLDVMFSPLLPFIDPGSPAFEHPEKTGYRLFARTLAEHRDLLRKPDLREALNYETDTLTRAAIIDIGAEAMEKIADVREQCGVLTSKWAERERAKYREAAPAA
jgi:B12-binding domain/radical SAM domain protein